MALTNNNNVKRQAVSPVCIFMDLVIVEALKGYLEGKFLFHDYN